MYCIDVQNQTLEKTREKMLEKYGDCDNMDGDRLTAPSLDRYTPENYPYHDTTSRTTAERHTQIF